MGRVDLRAVEIDTLGNRVLNRRGLRAILALSALMDEEALGGWGRIEALLRRFVGPQDFASVDKLGALSAALPPTPAELKATKDADIYRALARDTFDVQRIRGQFMYGGAGAQLPISVTVFGQRYIVDSHVLSNVVWDSVGASRMLPDPLDAAFAAFGNDQAAALLEDELQTWGYAGDLAAMRALIDDRSAEDWSGDIYSSWVNLLRTLSPDPAVAVDPAAHGRPAVWGTEAWGRRMLNTQLGSWTELRHDNLLYAKPSYTGSDGCDYPDGYVEPVPAFYRGLAGLAERGVAVAEGPLRDLAPGVAADHRAWWKKLYDVATTLEGFAEQQLSGEPFDEAQIAWLEQAVHVSSDGYIGWIVGGWYGGLIQRGVEDDPYALDNLVADIHTQPTEPGGRVVGNVLHLGTSDVRLMVTTVESCTGPRAYVGPVYATHSVVTTDFERLTDRTWNQLIRDELPPELPWLQDLVVR